MEIKGKIVKILPLQSGEGKNGAWKRQEYVLEYGDQYPKLVCFSLRGNRVDQYPINIDDEVIVSFDIQSREWNGRYYTDIMAWKVEKASEGSPAPSAQAPVYAAPAAPAPAAESFSASGNESDDLPF